MRHAVNGLVNVGGLRYNTLIQPNERLQMTTSTVKFATFPFTYQGVNFVSRIAETSRFLPQIMLMGEQFIEMNIAAINDCMPDLVSLSIDELNDRLAYINEGGTEMFLELAGN